MPIHRAPHNLDVEKLIRIAEDFTWKRVSSDQLDLTNEIKHAKELPNIGSR